MPRRVPTRLLAAVVGTVFAVTAGCGDAGGGPSVPGRGCAGVETDPLDPRSTQHLLPGAPEPAYASDPPTSGPHLVTPALPRGVQSEPVPRPLQVTVLEGGGVLIQHKDLTPRERAAVEALAEPEVVVAPAPVLPAPVVATAWRRRLMCTTVDVAALRDFVAAHRGKVGPEGAERSASMG